MTGTPAAAELTRLPRPAAVIRPVFGAPSKDLRMSMAAIFAVISVNVVSLGYCPGRLGLSKLADSY